MINIYEPYLNDDNLKYAHDAIDSTWISSHGKYLNKVKDRLKEINGSKYVLLCNNGTSATHLLAIGLKYKRPSINKIIVPNNVYVAAWNMFLSNPYYDIIPVDSDINTWNYDLDKLKEQISNSDPQDTAILIVHNIGNIINVPKLKEEFPDFLFVEDNCEGFTGEYEGSPSGSKSLISSVSFFGNKTITSGEGGALFTDDKGIFEYLNSVRCQGLTSKKFVFDKIGYNYRMTNIQAAILYGQLKSLSEIKEKKSKIFNRYKEVLGDRVFYQAEEDNTIHSQWMFGVRFKGVDIKNISLNLFQNAIDSRPMFPPISQHKHLDNFNLNNEVAETLYNTALILPSHPMLQESQIDYICKIISDSL